MKSRLLKVLVSCSLLIMALCCTGGCGYHSLTSTVVHDKAAVKNIYIPVFVNRSYRASLETLLANSITEQFARRRGEWRIAGEGAEYILSGVIVSYELVPVAYTYQSSKQLETVAEYRSTITVEITLKKSNSGETVWKRRLSLFQNMPANSSLAIQQNSEDAAILEVCQKLAQDIYVGLADDF